MQWEDWIIQAIGTDYLLGSYPEVYKKKNMQGFFGSVYDIYIYTHTRGMYVSQ